MKKSITTILFSVFVLLFSCTENSYQSLDGGNNPTNLSSKQFEYLKNNIENTFKKNEINVEKITAINTIGDSEMTIVEYEHDGGKKSNIGLNFLNSTNAKLNVPELPESSFKIWCTGDCDCALEGIIDPNNPANSYTQCKCTNCEMHIIITSNYPNANKTNSQINIEDIASESFMKTFGKKADKISVTKFGVEKYKDSYIYTIFYSDGSLNSSVLLLTNYIFPNTEEKGARSSVQELPKDFVVDCTGSCDCRERFFPATGAIECTCAPCKMEVTEVVNP